MTDYIIDIKTNLPRVYGKTRDELIFEFMPDALKQKWRFVYHNPTKEEDIHSVALLALVEAVDWWLINRTDDNLGSVVCHFVNLQVRDYLLYDHTVRCPKSQKVKPVIVSATLHDDDGHCYEDFTLSYQQASRSSVSEQAQYLELINRLELSYRQKAILELRIQGYTLAEIGSCLGISTTWVYENLEQIAGRYERLVDC